MKIGDRVNYVGRILELAGQSGVITGKHGARFTVCWDNGRVGSHNSIHLIAADVPKRGTPAPAPKLPRLELQAAPQGGFLVIAPGASQGYAHETLSAHSEIDDALEFMRRAMA